MIIELNSQTPVNLEDRPEGFTKEDALEVRALVVRLRAAGLHVLFAVASGDKAFQYATGDARVLAEVAGETTEALKKAVRSK